ncbi:MAG: uracil-DNA glycosylase [Planctomycetes bacterium]|nr:uracil-DNA glycosylase [Planctomycetota bacterium]
MTTDRDEEALCRKVLAQRSYARFRAALHVSGCRRCRLWEGRTRIVVDRGDHRARILLVGEGPGAEEDRLGLAFVGRSGRLLDDMLREAGIDPERDVLIANVVKCRPPENRAPFPDEAEACLPYLARQIRLVRPRVLGLLGATAARHVLSSRGAERLGSIVGRILEEPAYPGVALLPLFHPAYILRNPAMRGIMVEHLNELRRRA